MHFLALGLGPRHTERKDSGLQLSLLVFQSRQGISIVPWRMVSVALFYNLQLMFAYSNCTFEGTIL